MKNWVKNLALMFMAAAIFAGCGNSSSAPSTDSASTGGTSAETETTGSSDQAGTETNANAEKPTIALITINQEALFFTEMVKGAKEEAEKLGAELVVFNPNNDPVAQNNAIQDFTQQGVDAIIVNAIDVNGVVPAIEEAAAAGIPVISVDSVVESEGVKVQIGVDNLEAGRQIGDYFKNYVLENWNGEVKLGIVGALNSFIQNQRKDGFTEAFADQPGITVVDVVDGENVQEKALAAAENLMTGNPDLQAIYATGEPALIGTVAAVQSQQKQNQVKVFGWDLTKQAIEGIDAGWVQAVVQQDPKTEGIEAVRASLKLIQGESVDKNINVPVTIVTQENVDQFRSLFE